MRVNTFVHSSAGLVLLTLTLVVFVDSILSAPPQQQRQAAGPAQLQYAAKTAPFNGPQQQLYAPVEQQQPAQPPLVRRVQSAAPPSSVASEAPPSPLAKAPRSSSAQDAFSLARDLMSGQASPAQSFNINNRQATIKMGNSKEVNVNTITNQVTPTITNSRFGKLDLGSGGVSPSLAASNKAAPAGVTPPALTTAEPPKAKATPEQKELKKKLLELADKATSPVGTEDSASLLKFNHETEQFEPVAVDPNVTLYKQKLQDAIKALSAKKLPAERLKEALDGFGSEPTEGAHSGDAAQGGISGNLQGRFAPRLPAAVVQPPIMEDNEEMIEIEQPEEEEEGELPTYEEDAPVEGEEEMMPFDEEHYEEGMPAAYEEEEEAVAPSGEGVDPLMQMREILADRLNRISDLLYFRPEFLNQLLQIDDVHLTPIEAEFKRMILCNSDEQFCQDDLSKYVHPDGLLPPPLSEEDLLPPEDAAQYDGEEEQLPLEHGEEIYGEEEELPQEEEGQEHYEEDNDNEAFPPSPPPSPVHDFVPRNFQIPPPAGAKHHSFSKTSVNYQYDQAHSRAEFGDDGGAPVVQRVARAGALVNGRPMPPAFVERNADRFSLPVNNNAERRPRQALGGVKSSGPGALPTPRRPAVVLRDRSNPNSPFIKRRRFDEPQSLNAARAPAAGVPSAYYGNNEQQQQQSGSYDYERRQRMPADFRPQSNVRPQVRNDRVAAVVPRDRQVPSLGVNQQASFVRQPQPTSPYKKRASSATPTVQVRQQDSSQARPAGLQQASQQTNGAYNPFRNQQQEAPIAPLSNRPQQQQQSRYQPQARIQQQVSQPGFGTNGRPSGK